jgi:hypothetical protein
MSSVLSGHENLNEDKLVESVWFPRLDEGSTPSSSTNKKSENTALPKGNAVFFNKKANGGLQSSICFLIEKHISMR